MDSVQSVPVSRSPAEYGRPNDEIGGVEKHPSCCETADQVDDAWPEEKRPSDGRDAGTAKGLDRKQPPNENPSGECANQYRSDDFGGSQQPLPPRQEAAADQDNAPGHNTQSDERKHLSRAQ